MDAALGKIPLSLKIESARVLNVYSGEVSEQDIGIFRDTIVFVGKDSDHKAEKKIDGTGKIAIPGLIDTHLHIESTMLTPSNFASAVLPCGTTTVFADPHEIVNVLGKSGLKMMLESSRDLPMKIHFLTPTCVPESNAVTSGAEMSPGDIEETLDWDGIAGLGEVMDFDAVLSGSDKMLKILEIGRRRNTVIDGHCPLLRGASLAAYAGAGPEADHENFEIDFALEKLRAGMYLKLRGPDVLDMHSFIAALNSLPSPINVILVTDDVMPDRLALNGHLNYVCRAAVEAGMDPVQVVRSATLRPALHMRQFRLGAIAPGKQADIVLLKDLRSFDPSAVISNGVLVAQAGKMIVPIPQKQFDKGAINSVKLEALGEQDFQIPFPVEEGRVRLNCIDLPVASRGANENVGGGKFLEMVLTNASTVEVEINKQEIAGEEISKIFVFERHGKNRNRSFGFAKNLLWDGALATTIAHDAHNLVVLGKAASDMRVAANSVIQSRGGVAAVRKGKILAKIDLPIAGLISELPLEALAEKMRQLRAAFKEMGMIDHPYMPIPFLLTLSVIPHVRITDKGIFKVDSQRFLSPFSSPG